MSNRAKIWLIIAVVFILVGMITFGSVMTVLSWDFTQLSTDEYETNEYGIHEPYHDISIVTGTAHVVILPAKDWETSVVCYESQNLRHSVAVKDGTLTVEVNDTRKWYEHIGLSFDAPQITVYLPKGEQGIPQGEYGALTIRSSTGDIKIAKDFTFESIDIVGNTGSVKSYASASGAINIKTDTGSICIQDASAGALELSVSTGRVSVEGVTCEGDVSIRVSTGKTSVKDCTCNSLTSDGDTGDLSLTRVTVAGTLSVERSTGDVRLERCDAAEIVINTDTGDVEGSLLSDKIFAAKSGTGDVEVPETGTGGRCIITTDTGDISITVE